MAGLDNAALPEDTDNKETSGLSAVSAKPVPAKGKLALPTPTGGVSYDPSLLAKMEALIKQKEAEQSGVMSALQDATAWWSGGVAGPGEALAKRAEQRAAQQADLFSMQSQLSQAKTAQQRAAAMQEANRQRIAGGAGGIGGGGVGGGTGGGAAAGALSFLTPAARQQYEYLNNMVSPEAANDYLQKIVAKNQEQETGFGVNPAAYSQAKVWNEAKGEWEMKNPMQMRAELSAQGRPQMPLQGAPTVTGVPQGGAAQAATAAGIPVISGDRDIAKQAQLYTNSQQPGYKGPPVAKPGQSLHQQGMAIDVNTAKLTPEHRKWLSDNGYVQTMPKTDPNHWAKLPAPSATPAATQGAAAPAISTIQPLPPAPKAPTPLSATAAATAPATAQPTGSNVGAGLPAFEQANLKQRIAEGQADVQKESAKKLSLADTEKKEQYIGGIGAGEDTYSKLDRLLESTKNQKEIFNLSGQGIIGPAAAKVLPKGEGDSSDNEKIARALLDEKKQTAFKNAAQGAAEAQAAWAKNLVQGAGGKLTNADLGLGKLAKGVGPDTTYEAHMQNLAKQMEIAKTVYYRGKEFDKWQKANPNGTVAEFEDTPYYKIGSKIDAARDVAKRVGDVPETGYVHKDKKGNAYVVINGKGYYL